MWELDHNESWAPNNWCFWTVMWIRLLRVPWTARRSKQSILKEISPEYSLERLMVQLRLQYFGHLMWRTDSLENDPDTGKDWRQEGKGRTEDGWLDGITDLMDMSLSNSRSWWWAGKPGVLQSTGSQRVGQDCVTELNWSVLTTERLIWQPDTSAGWLECQRHGSKARLLYISQNVAQ